MIQRITKRGKVYVTSSYFDDLKELSKDRMSNDFTFGKLDKEMKGQLQLAWAVTRIKLWQQGCRELSSYVESLTPNQLKEITGGTIYVGNDVDENDTSVAEVLDVPFTESLQAKLIRTK